MPVGGAALAGSRKKAHHIACCTWRQRVFQLSSRKTPAWAARWSHSPLQSLSCGENQFRVAAGWVSFQGSSAGSESLKVFVCFAGGVMLVFFARSMKSKSRRAVS